MLSNEIMPKQIVSASMEGERKRGKPGKIWTDYVQEDLLVMGIRNWHAAVRDR
jgi:hypothetical protein